MKRVRSQCFDEEASVGSKFAKLKNTVVGAFKRQLSGVLRKHRLNTQKNGDIYIDENGASTPMTRSRNSSFQRSTNSPITARQLQEYYNSLRLQNEQLFENLNSNDQDHKTNGNSDSNNNLKSTELNRVGSEKTKENTAPLNDKNEIVLIDETASIISKGQTNSDSDDASQFGIPPIYLHPDPLERANLVQLKKLMELEKYRRYRLNYLREHSRHLKHGDVKKASKMMKKGSSKFAKKLDLKSIPETRRNKSGTFGISLLDTVPDDEPETVKPIDTNTVSKLKFNDTKNESANFDVPSKLRSFNPTSEATTEMPEDNTTKPVGGEEPTKNAFKSNNVGDKSFEDQPSGAFTFKPLASQEKSGINQEAESLSFAKPSTAVTNEMTKSKPLSFGGLGGVHSPVAVIEADTEPKAKSSLMEKDAGIDSTNPKEIEPFLSAQEHPFVKDLKNGSASIDNKPSLFGSKDENKPTAFSFNPPPSNALSSDIERKDEKPSFSFNASTKKSGLEEKPSLFTPSSANDSTKTKVSSTPAFTFGSSSKVQDIKEPSSTSGFSFGQSVSVPKLNFGLQASAEKKQPPNSSVALTSGSKLNFGAKPQPLTTEKEEISRGSLPLTNSSENDKKGDSKTTFSFGTTSAINPEVPASKPQFNFSPGTSSDSTAPKLAFGAGSTDVSAAANGSSKPATTFNFGVASTSINTPKDAETKPATTFNFGSAQKPSPELNGDNPQSKGDRPAASSIPFKPKLTSGTLFDANPESKPNSTFSFGENKNSSEFSVPDGKRKQLAPADPKSSFNFTSSTFSTNTTQPNSAVAVGDKPSASAASGFSFSSNANTSNAPITFGGPNASKTFDTKTPGGFGSWGLNKNTSTPNGNPGFSFGTPGSNNNQSNNLAQNSTNSNQTPGKLFSFNSSKFPSINELSKPTGFATSQPAQSASLQNNSNGFNFAGNTNTTNNMLGAGVGGNGFGMNINNGLNSSSTAFGTVMNPNNSVTGGFGMNNSNSNNNGGFGGVSNNSQNGFNFGGNSGPGSAATSRSTTPNINFAGPTSNMNPAAIFNNTNLTPDQQQQISNRRKIYPRSRRR